MPAEKVVALFSGISPTCRTFKQGCVVSCDASVAPRAGAGLNSLRDARKTYRRPRRLPLTRRPLAAAHTTCRYASAAVTDARADADVLPNAHPSAATATRPAGRASALFIPPNATAFTRPLSRRLPSFTCTTGVGRPDSTSTCSTTRSSASRTSKQWAVHQNWQCRRQRPCRAFAVNYPNRRRLKLFALAELRELKDGADLARRPATKPRSSAWSCSGLNCPQHMPRFTEPEVEQAFEPDK